MKKQYKAVLFDYDGTLMDTNRIICESWQYMFREVLGHEVPVEKFIGTFGKPLEPALDEVMKSLGIMDKDPKDLAVLYRRFQAENPKLIQPFPGIKEMLFDLYNKGIKLGIVTSRGVDSLKKGLDGFGILSCFDGIVGAEDTDIHKPNPEPAILCCKKMNIRPEDSLMVGDSVFDLQCGHNAGTDACFVRWSFCTKEDDAVKLAAPEYIISAPEELTELF